MKAVLPKEVRDVIEAVQYRPSVSIIMPFETKLNAGVELTQQLNAAVDKVDREIRENYQDDLADLVIRKLRALVKHLKFDGYKKGIAIYVSPVFEKVLYLDIPVVERIVIDGSFEIRDLVLARREIHKYIVLLVSAKWSHIYIADQSVFTRVATNEPEHSAAFSNDISERTANFSDPSYRKEVLLDKFLHHTDNGLKFILQSYQLPVFVMGTKKVLGHFKAITRNNNSIVGYVHGNYEEASEAELYTALKPHIDNWKKVRTEVLRHAIENAADAGKLSKGILEVWKTASQRKGRLLIVERDYTYTAEHGGSDEVICRAEQANKSYAGINDAVDDVIEKVLEHGGDVEFVEKNMLREYCHIALIQYY